MPRKPAQPEDKMWPELLDVLNGRRPRHDEWKRRMSFEAAKNRGGSGNWPWLANGIAAHVGDRACHAMISRAVDEPNDWDLNEPLADDRHWLYTMCGKTAARDALARPGATENQNLAERLTRELQQAWAVLLLHSTTPDQPERSWCVCPGARASAIKDGRDAREYLILRALGLSHDAVRKRASDGRGICNRMDRIYDHKEVSLASVVDALVISFRADFEPVYRAYTTDGFDGLLPFLFVGTRVPFEVLRTTSGLAAVMKRNCNGNNGPRWAVVWHTSEDRPRQFPVEAVPRQQTEQGAAELDLALHTVVAWGEHSGGEASPWRQHIPGGRVLAHVRLDNSGIHDLIPRGEPGGGPEPPIVPELPPVRKDRWWESL